MINFKIFNVSMPPMAGLSPEENEVLFGRHVKKKGYYFERVISSWFNPRNSWDQAVIVTILCNLLALIAHYSIDNGRQIDDIIKQCLEENLEQNKK